MNRILLVDDDIELTAMLAEYLRSEGFETGIANDGLEALKAVETGNYDLMVLDIMMPKMDGLEVLRDLNKTGGLSVLMLTAKGGDMDSVIGLELGADDYLAKPCNPRVLVAHIRAILRRSGEKEKPKKSSIQIQDVLLNRGNRVVTRNDSPIEMTSTEFQVLEVLMLNAGHVVEKSELQQQALGKPLGKYDRSLDMHVSNLRKKLSVSPNGDERIKTVRGIGYQYSN